MSTHAGSAKPDAWVWNAAQGVYYHGPSDMYALPTEGEWTYLTPAQLAERGGVMAESSNQAGKDDKKAGNGATEDKEEGEVDDDVGWGGLMKEDELARVVKNSKEPAYGDMKAKAGATPHGEDRRVPSYERRNGHDPYGRDRSSDRPAPGERHPAYGEDSSSTRNSEYGDRDALYGDDKPAYGDKADYWDPAFRLTSTSPPPADPSAHILRLVVRRSKALEIGSVAVLDARDGGIQIGRDRAERGAPARVRVREMEASKTHALVYWGVAGGVDSKGADEEGWWVVDLGSTLGTYIAHRGEQDATRLSEAKTSSRPYPLHHLSRLTVGTTTFAAHVHRDWPCTECQLGGNVEIPLDDGTKAKDHPANASPAPTDDLFPASTVAFGAAQRKGQRQLKRKIEMASLRDTLLGRRDDKPANPGPTGASKGEYIDRSAQRRKLHRSSPPRTAPQQDNGWAGRRAATSVPAASQGPSETSRAMLAKHGWAPGQGLGRDGGGRAEPIVAVVRTERAGLGVRGQHADVPGQGGDWRDRGKQRRWEEARGE